MNNLTKNSKKLITISVIVSLLVIISFIVLYSIANKQGNISDGTPITMIIIILLALLSVTFMIFSRFKRTKYTKLLNKNFYEAYESFAEALQDSNLSLTEKKEVLLDVSGILLEAQQNGRTVSNVVGSDMDAFVNKVIQSFGYRNGFIFGILTGILYVMYMLLIIQTATYFIRDNGISYFNTTVGISILPYIVAISMFALPFSQRFAARKKYIKMILIPAIVLAIYITTHELLHKFGENISWINTYLDGETLLIKSWLIVTIWVVVIGSVLIAKELLRRRSIRNL